MRKATFTFLVCAVIAACVTAMALSSAASSKNSALPAYNDVPAGAWYEEAVAYVSRRGLMVGTSEGMFSPSEQVTRGMLLTVLHRMAGSPSSAEKASFRDVDPESYYALPVAWGVEKGVVTGYNATEFGPDHPVTREQMAAMLYRYSDASTSRKNTASLMEFSDHDKISAYALPAMEWAVSQGLLNGSGKDTLAPSEGATRAQIAAVVMRFESSMVTDTLAGSPSQAASEISISGGTVKDNSTAAVETQQPLSTPSSGNPSSSSHAPSDTVVHTPPPSAADYDFGAEATVKPPEGPSYTVVFRNYDGTELKRETVFRGKNATPPEVPNREGYTFVGWSGSYLYVVQDLILDAEFFEDGIPGESVEQTNEQTVDDLDNGAPRIKVGTVLAGAGDKSVTVPVNIRNNPGILGMIISVAYDESILTLRDAICGNALSAALNFTLPGRFCSQCRFVWDGQELRPEDVLDGNILTLVFDIADDAPSGTYAIVLFYNEKDIVDNDLEPVDVTVKNGAVVIEN